LNNHTTHKKNIFCCLLLMALFVILPIPVVFAHLEHGSAGGQIIGKYNVLIGLEPRNPIPKEPSKIIFSIQDSEGNDIRNVQTIVEIYEDSLKKRIFIDSWKQRELGDFEIAYTFEKNGIYQVVLNISENKVQEPITTQQPSLSGTLDCDCPRVVFNVSVSDYWFYLWNGIMVIAIVMICTVLGIALAMNYLKNKKNKKYAGAKQEVLKSFVMFLAIAGGLIHMSIYIEHAPLRIEYSMFLLLASITQIGFGVLFLAVLMFESSSKIIKSVESSYKKNTVIYLFGLIGSVVLVGLYTYVTTFTLPLSTYTQPENIEISGIIAISLEISLIGIISYLMYWEHAQKKCRDIQIKHFMNQKNYTILIDTYVEITTSLNCDPIKIL